MTARSVALLIALAVVTVSTSEAEAQTCNGTPGQWSGCRGNGCAVCAELVANYPCYFANHPKCSKNTTCGGQYYTCNSACPPPTAADACGSACTGTSGQWAGCRGNGCAVCAEKLVNYPCYFKNHPNCTKNDTCAGQFYTCNSQCPAPTAADACLTQCENICTPTTPCDTACERTELVCVYNGTSMSGWQAEPTYEFQTWQSEGGSSDNSIAGDAAIASDSPDPMAQSTYGDVCPGGYMKQQVTASNCGAYGICNAPLTNYSSSYNRQITEQVPASSCTTVPSLYNGRDTLMRYWGNSWFGGGYQAVASIYKDADRAEANSNLWIYGEVKGVTRRDFVRVDGNVRSVASTNEATGNVRAYVNLGGSYQQRYSASFPRWTYQGSNKPSCPSRWDSCASQYTEKNINLASGSVSFRLGPAGIRLTLRLLASVGVEANAAPLVDYSNVPHGVMLSAGPWAGLTITGQASASIWVAAIGADGQLNAISVGVYPGIFGWNDYALSPVPFKWAKDIDVKVRAGDGKITAWIRINYIFGHKRWQKTWRWDPLIDTSLYREEIASGCVYVQ